VNLGNKLLLVDLDHLDKVVEDLLQHLRHSQGLGLLVLVVHLSFSLISVTWARSLMTCSSTYGTGKGLTCPFWSRI
jgi:hypothetical protein